VSAPILLTLPMRPYEKMTADNTALMVIDVVNGCCDEVCEREGIAFSRIREMVPRLVAFIDAFRETVGGLVVFANITPWTREHLPENILELYTDPEATYFSSDASGFEEEWYLVQPRPDDAVITKNTYDAFSNPELRRLLDARGIRYLVVTGVFTDGCVAATVSGGFRDGYNFVLIDDLMETTDVPSRQKLSALLKQSWSIMYGKVMDAKTFLASW
jgi:nicotinamidase-related amidase